MRMMRRRGKNWGDAKERTPSSNLKISFLSVMHGHHCMDHETGGNESRSVGKGGGGAGPQATMIFLFSPQSHLASCRRELSFFSSSFSVCFGANCKIDEISL